MVIVSTHEKVIYMILGPAPRHALQPSPYPPTTSPHAPTLTPSPPAASGGRSCCDDADILSSYCREINAKDVFLAVLTVFLLFFSEEYVIQIVQRLSERCCRGLDVASASRQTTLSFVQVLRWPVSPRVSARAPTTSSNGFQECFVTLIPLRKKQVH